MPPITTHPTDAELSAFALGKPVSSDDSWIEEHVAGCEECQRRAAGVGPDSLLALLSTARDRAGAHQAAVPTPDPSAGATPSAYAQTQGWNVGTTHVDDEVPEALATHPKYRVVRRLGVGGMGTVWLAKHAVMNRPVAVKLIRPELLARTGAAARFLREVQAAAKLHQENIVTAFDAEQIGNSCLLVMEFVDGETLADRVAKGGALPAAEACQAIRDAARGLAHAHAAGLVHRDVKPHNLIRAADGTVKVLDFGLASVVAGEGIAAAGDGLTGAGMVAGTPDYIAPEQTADPHTADARADVYGLGCTLYHLLAGRTPFPDGTVVEKLDAHRSRAADPIPGLPAGLAPVLAKMMAKRPEDRFQTAAEVAAALEPFAGEVRLAPRRRWWSCTENPWATALALLFALVVLAGGVVYKIQRDNQEITITTDDSDVEVVMKRKGEVVRVIDKKSGQTWDIDTTTNRISLADTPDGLALELPDGAKVVMRRKGEKDGKPVFSVARVARPNPGAQARVEVKGRLLPVEIAKVLPPREGTVREMLVKPGDRIAPGADVAVLYSAALDVEYRRAQNEQAEAKAKIVAADALLKTPNLPEEEKLRAQTEKKTAEAQAERARQVIETLDKWHNTQPGKPGFFRAVAPPLAAPPANPAARWTVLDDRRENLVGRTLRPNEEVARVANLDGAWHVEARLAQEDVGKLFRWFADPDRHKVEDDPVRGKRKYIDADVFLAGRPDTGYRGRLYRDEIAAEAVPDKTADDENVPVVTAFVSLDVKGIPENRRVPREQLVTGLEVRVALSRAEPEPDKVGEVRKFEGHTAPVWSVALLPDERRGISCGEDGFVRCWELRTGAQLWAYDAKIPATAWKFLRAVAVSPDGTRALVAAYDYTVRVLDTATGKEVGRFTGHKAWVHGVSFSADGKRALSVSCTWDPARHEQDPTVRMWEVATGKELQRFEVDAPADPLKGVRPLVAVFARDESRVLSGSDDGTVREWDVKTGKELRKFEGHTEGVLGLALTRDGDRMFTGGYDKVVRVWNLKTGKELNKFEGHTEKITTVALTADARRVLTASEDGTVRLWDVATGKELYRCEGHTGRAQAAAITRDGRYALSGGQDGTVRLWRLPDPPPQNGGLIHDLPWPDGERNVYYARLSPDGRYVLAGSDNWAPKTEVWETATGKHVATIPAPAGAVFLPDNKTVLAAGPGEKLVLWDVTKNDSVRQFLPRPAQQGFLSVSADGTRAVSYDGRDKVAGAVVVWDVAAGTPVAEFQPKHNEGYLARISPDGKRVVTVGSKDRRVRLWEVPSAKPEGVVAEKKMLKEWVSEEGNVFGPVTFLPDGRTFITTSDTDTRGRVARFDEKKDAPEWLWDDKTQGVAGVSAHGRVAVIYNSNRTVRAFDLTAGKELGAVDLPGKVHGYMAVSADGRFAAATAATWQTKVPARVYVFRLPELPPAPKP